jgi:hypothetical protein
MDDHILVRNNLDSMSALGSIAYPSIEVCSVGPEAKALEWVRRKFPVDRERKVIDWNANPFESAPRMATDTCVHCKENPKRTHYLFVG